jgi:hypothetical protein
VVPRIKIHHSDASTGRSIKVAGQPEQIFELYCMIFKELKEEERHLPSRGSYK